MKSIKNQTPFGSVHIPTGEEQFTANYETAKWEEIRQDWSISAFLRYPGSNEPVESSGLSVAANMLFNKDAYQFDTMLDEIIDKYSDAWKQLAHM